MIQCYQLFKSASNSTRIRSFLLVNVNLMKQYYVKFEQLCHQEIIELRNINDPSLLFLLKSP